MKIELNTDICPIIVPDSYWTNICNYVEEDALEEIDELFMDIAKPYIKEALDETDFAEATLSIDSIKHPQFYNYGTDWIEFSLTFQDTLIDKIRETVNDNFFEYAKKFGSHPGFYSSYPTDKEKFYGALNGENNRLELAISMYIMWQFENAFDASKYQDEYLDDVLEKANGMGLLNYEDESDEMIA